MFSCISLLQSREAKRQCALEWHSGGHAATFSDPVREKRSPVAWRCVFLFFLFWRRCAVHRKVPSECGADSIFGLGSRPDKSRTSSCGDGQVFRWNAPSRERRYPWAQASPSHAVPIRGSRADKAFAFLSARS